MASDRIKSGCTKYARATVDIYFPDGQVCCGLCPMLETYSRLQCRRTGEYLLDKNITGNYCPLKLESEESNK